MIHYALRCDAGHEFDGWFRGSAAFDTQAKAGLLACPACATTQVQRAMMAPHVSSGAPVALPAAVPQKAPPRAASETPPTGGITLGGSPSMPDHMRAALQRIRAEVESSCDYVGPRFAEAARAIHEGSAASRPIYGETTPDQAAALAEDGIEVARIPWVARADG